MAQLYADENFPHPVVDALRTAGHDVLTIQDDGKANQRFPDDALLARTSELGRVLLTTNRKYFLRLHRESAAHAEIIICTCDPDPQGQALRIDEILRSDMPLIGKLLRVNRPQR
ncbi:MAG: DUF5615 family PIN-like protein [Caldilineaceae bacterium]|nr:DUF5615 family PIN-like protein [Caldilineaceae bacterium]